MRQADLRREAVRICGMVQATMGLEGQAVSPESFENLVQLQMLDLEHMHKVETLLLHCVDAMNRMYIKPLAMIVYRDGTCKLTYADGEENMNIAELAHQIDTETDTEDG